MATPRQQAAIRQEGRLELAIQAYRQGRFSSYRKAAKAYDIPRNMLQRRLNGTQPRVGSIAKNRLLTTTEEETLVQWILSMDRRGMPPRIEAVREMADLLVTQHTISTSVRPVS